MSIDVLESLTQNVFVEKYIAECKPCIVRCSDFNPAHWQPEALDKTAGELDAQIYDTLFDLQDIDTLSGYMKNYFNDDNPQCLSRPYLRWYSRLKDVDFYWGDEAFKRLEKSWALPGFVPKENYLVPVSAILGPIDPVSDLFPYRGILVAAKGSRTRLHRDPFFSDAIINQFVGEKEFSLYHPRRSGDLFASDEASSYGGFIDVRDGVANGVNAVPDVSGVIRPGDLLYIPRGWLHDVLVTEDSISVTWNFVHASGSEEYLEYLQKSAADDIEFDVLKYFYSQAGYEIESGEQALGEIYYQYMPE